MAFVGAEEASTSTAAAEEDKDKDGNLKSPSSSSAHKVQFAAEPDFDEDGDDDYDEELGYHSEDCMIAQNRKRQRRRTMSETSSYSLSSSTTTSSSSYSYNAPDGGWGWVIVAASFIVNMIADGVTFSFGVLFIEFQTDFGESKAVTAGVVSLFHAVPLLSGPIASALTDRYGCRKVTIVGSLLATLGFLLSSFSQSIELLYVTFGLLSGFGLSLCYVAAIVIVAYYFDRRRSFATGISVCGSGVGTFVFAPLTQYLIQEYGGWRGACQILAGFFLQMCVCGTLFRDLEWSKKKKKLSHITTTTNVDNDQNDQVEDDSFHDHHHHHHHQQQQQRIQSVNSITAAASMVDVNMPEIEELRAILQSGDITSLFTSEELEDCPRLSSSLVDLPTYISNNDRLPQEVITALSKNKRALKFIMENYPEIFASGASTANTNTNINNTRDRDDVITEENTHANAGIKLKRKVSSLFKKNPNKSILKKSTQSSNTCNNELFRSILSGQPSHNQQRHLHHLRVRRQSLTYRGAMLNISRYRLRASSCPDIYRNSMATLPGETADINDDDGDVVQAEVENAKTKNIFLRCFGAFTSYFQCMMLFINPSYVVFCLSNLILYAWYDVMYVYLVDYSEKDLSYSSDDATFLISVIGILNTVGEFIIGWAGDKSWMNMNFLYAMCMLACGIATAIVPFISKYSLLALMAGIYGFAISANYSLTSPILVELVSLEQFSNAYGLLLLIQGISNLVGPPFAGYLYDVTKNWIYTFALAGVFITISGLLLLILPLLRSAKEFNDYNKRRRLEASSSSAGTTVDDENHHGNKVNSVVVIASSSSPPIDIPKKNGTTTSVNI